MSTATLPDQNMLSIAPEDPDEGLVSQYRYAIDRGYTRPYIGRLVVKGIITLFNDKIKPEVADRQILEHTNPRNQSSEKGKGKSSGNNGDSLNAVRIDKERLNNELLEIQLKRKRGESVDRKKADLAYSSKITAVVRRLQKISKRISPAIALETDRIKCEAMIYNEIKEAVEEFGQHG